jgi:hypothetical protein
MWFPAALFVSCLIALHYILPQRKRHANQPVANRDDTKPGSPDQSRQRVRPPNP